MKQHVDNLFRGYRETAQVRDMKEEILGNLEAKTADLIAQGWDEEDAKHHAVASITSIDGLMDEEVKIAMKPFLLDLTQWTLIFLLLAWIIAIPSRAVGAGVLAQLVIMISLICVGCWYVILLLLMRHNSDGLRLVHRGKLTRIVRVVWGLWIVFLLICWLDVTGMLFASNIWFGRPIEISGPYQFAVIVYQYILPLLSLIVPLSARTALRILPRHERGGMA
ncbi:permease prefix domain 1-containing protein [Paenibacillus daejeonensis]|uniref:permease prefix domain 1-containing protein n=1 Tax=Paenibacillus daejeonensis TaxID=135193 RepID=UPI001B7FCFCF|nr:permease prefix domain 1-containing protein [Paenibacillus daejeonensis]